MDIKVIITYKNNEVKYYKFNSLLHLLNYQLSLSTKELDDVEAFDVYLGN